MSENKRVIRVKDLIIEAENVIIQPQRRSDPFFGGLRRDDERMESSHSSSEFLDSVEESDDKRDRGPFSWI